MLDPFEEAAAELGCDIDEIEGTFPPEFVGQLRRNLRPQNDEPS